ncbi:hypothetical protein DENSPDRAFT_886279 [Dentipellis sp. KUC8613]|nr:hypothetical protein DENSPDRAFT_886279 [Dentipellis sp. KUC8613]
MTAPRPNDAASRFCEAAQRPHNAARRPSDAQEALWCPSDDAPCPCDAVLCDCIAVLRMRVCDTPSLAPYGPRSPVAPLSRRHTHPRCCHARPRHRRAPQRRYFVAVTPRCHRVTPLCVVLRHSRRAAPTLPLACTHCLALAAPLSCRARVCSQAQLTPPRGYRATSPSPLSLLVPPHRAVSRHLAPARLLPAHAVLCPRAPHRNCPPAPSLHPVCLSNGADRMFYARAQRFHTSTPPLRAPVSVPRSPAPSPPYTAR